MPTKPDMHIAPGSFFTHCTMYLGQTSSHWNTLIWSSLFWRRKKWKVSFWKLDFRPACTIIRHKIRKLQTTKVCSYILECYSIMVIKIRRWSKPRSTVRYKKLLYLSVQTFVQYVNILYSVLCVNVDKCW